VAAALNGCETWSLTITQYKHVQAISIKRYGDFFFIKKRYISLHFEGGSTGEWREVSELAK
jgi:hypothetical protein